MREKLRIQLRGSAKWVLLLIMLPCKGAAKLNKGKIRIRKRNFLTEVGSGRHLGNWLISRGVTRWAPNLVLNSFGIQIPALYSHRPLLGSCYMESCSILGFGFLCQGGNQSQIKLSSPLEYFLRPKSIWRLYSPWRVFITRWTHLWKLCSDRHVISPDLKVRANNNKKKLPCVALGEVTGTSVAMFLTNMVLSGLKIYPMSIWLRCSNTEKITLGPSLRIPACMLLWKQQSTWLCPQPPITPLNPQIVIAQLQGGSYSDVRRGWVTLILASFLSTGLGFTSPFSCRKVQQELSWMLIPLTWKLWHLK